MFSERPGALGTSPRTNSNWSFCWIAAIENE
jgi:hypothetical protein